MLMFETGKVPEEIAGFSDSIIIVVTVGIAVVTGTALAVSSGGETTTSHH